MGIFPLNQEEANRKQHAKLNGKLWLYGVSSLYNPHSSPSNQHYLWRMSGVSCPRRESNAARKLQPLCNAFRRTARPALGFWGLGFRVWGLGFRV